MTHTFNLNATHEFSAPQFNLAEIELDDHSRDQIGTFAVALFVGALATLARVAVARRNRWWLNMLLIHGVIAVYWWTQCHKNLPESPWLTTVHGGLCWRNAEGQFQQMFKWGGDRERFWVNVLVWLAIFGNVVPAYAKGNEAGRHMTHVKRRACNPLINHIIAGVLCVVFPYFVVTWRLTSMIPVAVLLDLYHQITIHRLIANHDGIWVLRAASMSLAISKWIVILNMYTTDAVGMLDQMFIMSTGFLGTRAYGATAFICYYLGAGDIKTAQWYSIGLLTADVMIMGRCWGQMRIAFWLTVVNCAAMNYHQMWKKFIHLRPAFVGICAVTTMIVTHSGLFASLMFTIVWMIGNFMLPHFNRFRPAPPKDVLYTPTVSTRVIELSHRVSRRLSRRLSAFGKSMGLENSRKIRSKSTAALLRSTSDLVPSFAVTPRITQAVLTGNPPSKANLLSSRSLTSPPTPIGTTPRPDSFFQRADSIMEELIMEEEFAKDECTSASCFSTHEGQKGTRPSFQPRPSVELKHLQEELAALQAKISKAKERKEVSPQSPRSR